MRKALLLSGAIAFAAFCDVDVRAQDVKTQDVGSAQRISGPHVHENLAVYFIHGPSAAGPVPLTLAEAMAKKQVRVIETGNVNALAVENLGQEAVFIQSGDIVKGGQQDRVLTISLLLPKGSGKVSIDSFCVEAGRWAARGTEDVKQFSSSGYALPSREAKLAMRLPAKPQAEIREVGTIASADTAQHPRRASQGVTQGVQQHDGQRRLGATPRQESDTSTRQQKVWNEVARIQNGLSNSIGAGVAESRSKTSLQLSLENEQLKTARAGYATALEKLPAEQSDIVGFVFAIDGRINSADVYPSNGLFQKMWSKLLTASVTESLGARGKRPSGLAVTPPTIEAVRTFIAQAEAGKAHDKTIGGLMQQSTREADTALFVETATVGAAKTSFVHRNYLAK